jgi:hypothetical protein
VRIGCLLVERDCRRSVLVMPTVVLNHRGPSGFAQGRHRGTGKQPCV